MQRLDYMLCEKIQDSFTNPVQVDLAIYEIFLVHFQQFTDH